MKNVRSVAYASDIDHPWGDVAGGSGVLLASLSIIVAVLLLLARVFQ